MDYDQTQPTSGNIKPEAQDGGLSEQTSGDKTSDSLRDASTTEDKPGDIVKDAATTDDRSTNVTNYAITDDKPSDVTDVAAADVNPSDVIDATTAVPPVSTRSASQVNLFDGDKKPDAGETGNEKPSESQSLVNSLNSPNGVGKTDTLTAAPMEPKEGAFTPDGGTKHEGTDSKPGDLTTSEAATRVLDEKPPKDEDGDTNVKDTDPLLTKTDSQKTLQSDTGSSVKSDSSSDTKKPLIEKKKYSYIPIVGTGKDKNHASNDSKKKKGDKFDFKRDKDNKATARMSRSNLSGSSQNIALKDKSEPVAPSDAKGETTFSVVNENEKIEHNSKNVKFKENEPVSKDKKPSSNVKKESKIPELDKKKVNVIQKSLQREKAVLSNGSVKATDKEDDKKTDEKPKETEKKPLDPPVVETSTEPYKPKSILARAIMKKVKEGSGQAQNNAESKHVVLNGPPTTVKTPNKTSLAVPPPVSRDVSDDKDDRLSIGSRRDSTKLSLSDSMSRKSVDFRVANATTVVIPASGQDDEKQKAHVGSNDSWIRSAIPYMPLSLSILCLLLNIVVPGTGTMLSGFAILCCGKSRVPTKDDHVPITVCVNVWVGVAQLFTVTFMLVGWFWSVAWGIKMIILSIEYRKELRQKREKELQALALSAFGSPTRGARGLFG
ncbi:clumping factor A-like [Haliotis rubra]|uniref:clumping factor A-like n=1 Tax=Haliotis rubra TaxID=36100 RepID=UPI001EE59A73|nr:clumping factor A-like [Haliotis rubra]